MVGPLGQPHVYISIRKYNYNTNLMHNVIGEILLETETEVCKAKRTSTKL